MVRWNANKLPNYQKRIDRLRRLERMQEDGTFDVLPKKVIQLMNEKEKLEKYA